jgi:NAD(P)-dependent dehydrogenase (short-subunit alcohol dehydrogenase family)
VTGGGQGTGRGSSLALAAAGAQVVVADSFEDTGEETVALIEKAGGAARLLPNDVTSDESIRTTVAAVGDAFGRLDVLVNNGATYRATARRPIDDLTVEQWDTTMAVFVRSVWLTSRAAVPLMSAALHPAIVNHTSVAAYGVKEWLDYGTARGAVIALTKSLALELAPRGIRVNAMCVGSMGLEAVALGVVVNEDDMLTTPDFARQPIQRLGRLEDVGGAVVFLASEASSYMTGQTVVLDGGKFFLG